MGFLSGFSESKKLVQSFCGEKRVAKEKSLTFLNGFQIFKRVIRDCIEMEAQNDELDSVVRAVIDKFVQRARVGKLKYGTDLDNETDLV